MSTPIPPRLHLLTRPGLDQALIIRRGPAKRVGFFGLDLKTHEVTEGQWLNGRIYERRSDLSPDGKYIIYFAANHIYNSATKGAWTAVSRFPYLKALDLWGKGNTYNGGGLFLSADEYLLNEIYSHTELEKTSHFKVRRGKAETVVENNECLGIYFPKLIRDGWELVKKEKSVHHFQKNQQNWRMRKRSGFDSRNRLGVGGYYDENELVNQNNEVVLAPGPGNWMDFRPGQVWWTTEGKVMCGDLQGNEVLRKVEVVDMAAYSFRKIVAPYGRNR